MSGVTYDAGVLIALERRIGRLARATGASDAIDLSVAEGALRHSNVVVTSDPHGLTACSIPKGVLLTA